MSVHLDTDSTQLSPAVTHGREVRIVILSRDGALISDIESALEGMHRVHHARRAASVIDVLIECNAGVLVTDMAERPAYQNLSRQLRQMFPNLLIIGVGDRDAAELLIESINSGQVDSVMLKPLSSGRVRLQVQSAVRQHLLSREADLAAEMESAEREWDGDRTEPQPVELLKELQPEVSGAEALPLAGRTWRRPLLISGAIAGALTAAIALTLVLRGGETIGWRGLVGGKAAAVAGSVASANSSGEVELAPAAAASAIPSSADRGSLLIASMNLATAPDNLTVASEQLDLAARMLPPDSPELIAARVSLAGHREQVAIRDRLALANGRIEANNLSLPENDSAMFHLMALQADHPDDEGVIGGLERLADIMLGLTDAAILEEDFRIARRWLGKADELGVREEALTARRQSLANAEDAAAEAVLDAEAALTEAALDEELALAEAALAAASLFKTVSLAGASGESANAGPDSEMGIRPVQVASISPVAVQPEAGAGTQFETGSAEISELRIVQMVQPEYPRRAYVRDIDGWIEVEFTVTETGRTRAIEVTGEKHPGWFDRAAIEAVKQWQFLPELRNGQPVERRAKVRLQFTRDD